MEKFGVATAAEVDLATLTERMTREVAQTEQRDRRAVGDRCVVAAVERAGFRVD
jgi:hypothetical protein